MKRSPMPRRNPARLERLRATQFASQAAACRESRCVVCKYQGRVQDGPSIPHHHPSRGAGGVDADTMPLCDACHRAVHAEGCVSFWARVGLDPDRVIAAMRASLTDDGLPF